MLTIPTTLRRNCQRAALLLAMVFVLLAVGSSVAAGQAKTSASNSLILSSPQYEELDNRLDRIEFAGWFVSVFLGLGFAGIVGGTVALYFSLRRWAKKYARKALRKELHRDSKVIAQLIDERSEDNRIKRKTSIAVVSRGRQLASVLQNHGFRKLQRLDPTEVADQNLATFGAIVFDLDDGLTHQEAATLLDKQGIENALGYSLLKDNKSPLVGRCTFANSHITLYWRLLELFKYWEANEEL